MRSPSANRRLNGVRRACFAVGLGAVRGCDGVRWRDIQCFCVPPLHINNCRNRVIVLNALNAEFVTLRVKLRMAGNVSRPKDFYRVFLCSNAIVSTCPV